MSTAAALESVWDYPRPPRLERSSRRIRVVFGGVTIADSTEAFRVLETSHPPTWYLPPKDFRTDLLLPSARTSFCEWKGRARYWTLQVGERAARDAVWDYPEPTPRFALIAGYLSLYPGRMDGCFVDDERVLAQAGDFYGGWITSEVSGPFKGGPGTAGW
jgi:uncharacterized protein (DUF427 family)